MQKTVFVVGILIFLSPILAFSAESNQSPTAHIASQGPSNAPITIIQFSDFQCPFCARALPVAKRILKEYPGQVRWVFKHYPLPFHNDAHLAHEAVLAAGEQGKFWEMHDLIFANQSEMKRSQLLEYASQLDLNIKIFTASLDSGKYKSVVENDIKEGLSLGAQGVPAFFINWTRLDGVKSFETFKSVIDAELAIVSSKDQEHGQKLSPLTAGIANSPVQGSKEAPITIIEFSDFQSPICAEVVPLIDQVMEKYSGKVKWVFKHNPHGATQAHEAAFAAGEQGKFWEMRDLIFSKQVTNNDLDHILYATQLGLDMDRFMTDLNSGRHQAMIEQDKALGEQLGVSEAPTFFINGKKLVDVKSSSEFEAIIEKELGRLEQTMAILGNARKRSSDKVATVTQKEPVKIMVFSDFQNPVSARTARLLKSIQVAYPDQIRLMFKHYPMDSHHDSKLAHRASLAAEEQGKFWEMHDLIFANTGKLGRDQLVNHAKLLKLDMKRFMKALDGKTYQSLLNNYVKQGKRLHVRSVPTLFIDGKRVDNISSMESLKTLLEAQLKQERLCKG